MKFSESEIKTGAAAKMNPDTVQQWKAGQYAQVGRFVADHAGKVMEWLAPQPGERVLDLACGDGWLTEKIAASGAVVVGVDASGDMVRAARARGIDARLVRGEQLESSDELAGGFDAVFSNAALHWMRDQAAVLRGVRRVLRPGGRFIAEMGGHGNVAAIRIAIAAVLQRHGLDRVDNENQFFTVDEYRALLERAGFVVEEIELAPRPTLVKEGMKAWLETFRSGLLAWFPEAEREQAIAEMVELLAPALADAEGNWWADYVRLRWRATAR
jgi:SAM-dependent methyltransferase